MIDLTKENIDNLRYAIVKATCDEYLEIKKLQHVANIIRPNSKKCKKYKKKLDRRYSEIMEFFNSEWYRQLCDIDASIIIMGLDGDFEEWTNNLDEVLEFIRLYREKPKKAEVPA